MQMRSAPFSFTLPGAWGALALSAVSFTPSLLPRPAPFQGLVAGATAALGYGVGVLVAYAWRELAGRDVRPTRPRSWRVLAVVAAVVVVAAMVLGQVWQHQIRDLMGMGQEAWGWWFIIPVLWAVVAVVMIQLGRAVRWVYRKVVALLDRAIGARAAKVVGLVVVGVLLVTAVDGVLFRSLRDAADNAFAVRNAFVPDDIVEPTDPTRSGSPDSLVSWDSLGREGRIFVAGGPTREEIGSYLASTGTGGTAADPVRVFAGLESADTFSERARLAVDDLVRAGGFTRKNLMIVTSTGSGWVSESSSSAFEYLTGGDSAIVGTQYSWFPSWISYLVDQQQARDSGRELFDAVYEYWLTLPADSRPKLYVFGESLGSFGGESAFSGAYDMANRTSGVLFVGPPNFNPLWNRFTRGRDDGSPEVLPVLDNGQIVRFSRWPRDGVPPEGQPWGTGATGGRVLYLQHASDPITWWSTDLIFNRPDWLSEKRGPDVLSTMGWFPIVTFGQVTADMALGTEVPAGYGHNFEGEHVDAWANLLRVPDWTPARSEQLRTLVAAQEADEKDSPSS